MDPTAQRVIDTIVENRKTFEAFCYPLSAEELDRPVPDSTWIVRDFAAHLATLDPAMAQLFDMTKRGDTLTNEDGSRFDVDAFNEEKVVERRDWPLERVFAESGPERQHLIDVIGSLTEADVDKPMHFTGDAKRPASTLPLKLFLAGWAQHDPIHAADMLRALPDRAADPALKAWTDNPFVAGYQRMMNP